jgi:hypothetical protein
MEAFEKKGHADVVGERVMILHAMVEKLKRQSPEPWPDKQAASGPTSIDVVQTQTRKTYP